MRPMGLGRTGARVAKTPTRGISSLCSGRTFKGGDSSFFLWSQKMTMIWENSSNPSRASENLSSITTWDSISSQVTSWESEMSFLTQPMGSTSRVAGGSIFLPLSDGRRSVT